MGAALVGVVATAAVGVAVVGFVLYKNQTQTMLSTTGKPVTSTEGTPAATPAVTTPAQPPATTSTGSTGVAATSSANNATTTSSGSTAVTASVLYPGLDAAGVAVYQAAISYAASGSGSDKQTTFLNALQNDPDAAAIIASAGLSGSSDTTQTISAINTLYGSKYGPVIAVALKSIFAAAAAAAAAVPTKSTAIAVGDHKGAVLQAAQNIMQTPTNTTFQALLQALAQDPNFVIWLSSQPSSVQATLNSPTFTSDSVTAISPGFTEVYGTDSPAVIQAFRALVAYGYNPRAASAASAATAATMRIPVM